MKTESKTAIVLGIIIIGIVGVLATAFSFLEMDLTSETSFIEQVGDVEIDKSNFKKAPELVGIANYINTNAEELKKEIQGKVVLFDIWTYSCINCVRTLPHITAWNEKYSDQGLLVVGIHSPEFEFEKDFTNVQKAVKKHGITYPVVLDNEMKTWKAFENRYWPRKYLADSEGYLRYDHIGEGAYEETEKVIQKLLEERAYQLGLKITSAETLVNIKEFEHSNFRTPELYFGYQFAQGRNQLGSPEGFKPNQDISYTLPENLQQNLFYLDGTWKNFPDGMELVSDKGAIVLPYHAKEVNIVASNDSELEIFLDGIQLPDEYKGKSVISENKVYTSESDLYNIINSDEASTHLLVVSIVGKGFKIYTFTFG